jgi:hypothetical protein
MKRCLGALALLLLLIGLLSDARADYVIIRLNLAGVGPSPGDDKGPKGPGPGERPGQPMVGQPGVGQPGVGQPGVGQPGVRPGPGPGPGPGVRPGQPGVPGVGKTDAPAGPPLMVVAIVEYSKAKDSALGDGHAYMDHKWGRSEIENIDPRIMEFRPVTGHPTIARQFDDKKTELRLSRDKTAKRQLEMADWCLGHGLINESTDFFEAAAAIDANDPVVKAYKQVKDGLAKAPSRDDPAIAWKERTGSRAELGEHYVVLYDPAQAGPDEAKKRLYRLEQSLRGVYYWFALKGKALPMPERRMVALLVDKPEEFQKYSDAFADAPIVEDSLFARRDNLLVLSGQRLDPAAEPLARIMADISQQGWDLKQIMSPKYKRPQLKTNEQWAYASTMALVKKAVDEQADQAAASHQGTRELFATIGLLPRTVQLPEWVQYGLPSVFEVSGMDADMQIAAFWPGVGIASWKHLTRYKLLEGEKQLDTADVALDKVITDQYFLEAREKKDADALAKARALAWSLSYFLAQRHTDELMHYGEQLAALPRDLELDSKAHSQCFERAFGLTDAGKKAAFAKEWYAYNTVTALPMQELIKLAQEGRASKDKWKNPMNPAVPAR